MLNQSQVVNAIEAGAGILRLEPCWVPRAFLVPGRRLKLHPDDIYALGGERGGIDERWFSSTIKASNGPLTRDDEGLSYVHLDDGKKFLLKDAVEVAGDSLLGSDVMSRIHYDTHDKSKLLQRTLLGYLTHVIEEFPVDPKSIFELVVAGMMHVVVLSR